MSEVIVITSGKGGVGKTTTTANVGTGLAKEGKKVVLIDTDIGLRNLDVVMGLENRIGNMVYWAQQIVICRRCFRENETSRSMRDRSFSDRGFDLFRYSEKTYSHAFK